MNHVDLDAIANYLKTFPSITTVCDERVFTETPLRDQTGISLFINLFGDPIDTEVSKKAGVSIRAMAHTTDVSVKVLRDLLNTVSEVLTGEYDIETPVPDFGFGVFKISEISFSPPLSDDKGRRSLVKDYVFYFSI